MKNKLIARAAAAFLIVILSTPAWAQQKAPVIDGNMWLSSTAEVRKAFLVGAGSMIALESAYSKKKGTPPPVAGSMAAKALDELTLDEVSDRITRWYEANPARRNVPVMGVIWIDMVQPRAVKK
jgi:hypothetical protein